MNLFNHHCNRYTFRLKPLMIIAFATIAFHSNSQNRAISEIPGDTSFNIQSEFIKQVRNFPYIEIVGIGDTLSLIIHRNVEYNRIEERRLHADIIYPVPQKKNESYPVIILIHGGGWRSGDKSMEHPLAFELARRGYATICIEYRLSMEAKYPAALEDVITAIKWTKLNPHKYPFNTSKVVLQGTSAGAQLASLAGSLNGTKKLFDIPYYKKQSEKVQAVINLDGVLALTHPDSGEGQDRPDRPSAATLWFGATSSEAPELWQQASALTHVNKASAPTLFISSSIPRFHAGRDDMTVRLNSYKITTEVHEHENCMHTFWLFYPWFDQTVEWIDQFLKRVL
jgi:acetyl esterase/lipase